MHKCVFGPVHRCAPCELLGVKHVLMLVIVHMCEEVCGVEYLDEPVLCTMGVHRPRQQKKHFREGCSFTLSEAQAWDRRDGWG